MQSEGQTAAKVGGSFLPVERCPHGQQDCGTDDDDDDNDDDDDGMLGNHRNKQPSNSIVILLPA